MYVPHAHVALRRYMSLSVSVSVKRTETEEKRNIAYVLSGIRTIIHGHHSMQFSIQLTLSQHSFWLCWSSCWTVAAAAAAGSSFSLTFADREFETINEILRGNDLKWANHIIGNEISIWSMNTRPLCVCAVVLDCKRLFVRLTIGKYGLYLYEKSHLLSSNDIISLGKRADLLSPAVFDKNKEKNPDE